MTRILALALMALIAGCTAAADKSVGADAPTAVVVLSSDSVVVSTIAGASPVTQVVTISAGGIGTPFAGLVIGAARYLTGTGWLVTSLSPSNTLSITVDARALQPGEYSAMLPVSASNAPPKDLRVRLVVRARPVLVVEPVAIALTAAAGDGPSSTTVDVKSSGDVIGPLTLVPATCDAGSTRWLTAALSAASTPATIKFDSKPAGLAPGTYGCVLTVATEQTLVDSATRKISVSLTVRDAPRIALGQTSISLTATTNNTDGPRSIAVTNGGSGVLDKLGVGTIDYGTGPNAWLTATLDRTAAPATLALTARATGMAPGSYAASVPVTSAATGVSNSPQTVRVTFVVEPPPPPPPAYLVISPSEFSVGCRRNQGYVDMGSFAMFMADGSPSQITGGSATSFTPGAQFAWGPPDPWVVPSNSNVLAYCGSIVGTLKLVMKFTAANGTSATLSFTAIVSP